MDSSPAFDTTVKLEFPVDHVALIVLDSPPMNTLSGSTRPLLIDIWRRLQDDPEIRAAIVTGAGEAFSAGGDLKEIQALHEREDQWDELLREGTEAFTLIEELPFPVIAAVNGYCMGGGFEFALWCDLRLASETAKFQASGVNVGLMTNFSKLPMFAGLGRAKEMLFTGYTYDAAMMKNWGVVTDVLPPDALMDETLKLAQRIATRAPLSIEATKRAANESYERTRAGNLKVQFDSARQLMATQDHREALDAFVHKREPRFQRR